MSDTDPKPPFLDRRTQLGLAVLIVLGIAAYAVATGDDKSLKVFGN